MEGIFRNWNPYVVHSKKPITGKPNQKGCQNQQPSIDNGAPLEECSNHVVIHNITLSVFYAYENKMSGGGRGRVWLGVEV
jgi:hypothetical protein